METFVLLARIGLGAVFLAAGVAKLIEREEFEKHLPAFGVRWPRAAWGMSYGLPAAECVLGILLIAGLFIEVAALAVAGLLLAFTVVVAVALARHTSVACSCFGNIGRGKITLYTLARNAVLLAVAIWLVGMRSFLSNADPWLPSFMAGVTAALTVLLAAQYLSLKASFLPLPLPPHKSGISWHDLVPRRGGA